MALALLLRSMPCCLEETGEVVESVTAVCTAPPVTPPVAVVPVVPLGALPG